MTKRSILLASLPVLLLGGCLGTANRGLESVHQPVVSRTDYSLDLATSGGNGLAYGERQRLAGWLATMKLGYGDHVAIDDPAGAGIVAREQVANVVARHGLLLSEDSPVTAAPVTPGTLRVVVSRSRADVPGCPDWSRDASHEFESNTSSNQGCAINSNLAAMIANPQDLVRGQSAGDGLDPAGATKAIEAFRKSAPSGGGGKTVAAAATGSGSGSK